MALIIDSCSLIVSIYLFWNVIKQLSGQSFQQYRLHIAHTLQQPKDKLEQLNKQLNNLTALHASAIQSLQDIYSTQLSELRQQLEIRHSMQLKKLHAGHVSEIKALKKAMQAEALAQICHLLKHEAKKLAYEPSHEINQLEICCKHIRT